ncbi:hypothetical protein Tco_0335793 [Tanacetum coccineum]
MWILLQGVPNADSGTDDEPLEQDAQNDVGCDDERVALANLIANLKLDVDENKKIQKQLKKANATLTQELTECKSILAETSRTLGESNSIRDSCLVALQNKQTEFERYKAFNDRTVDYDKLEHKLNEAQTISSKRNDINEGDLKYDESLEDELDELESDKAQNFTKLIYTELLRSFAKLEKHSISLEIALQQCQEQLKNDTVCKEKASNVFRKEREQYFEIQDLKAQLQDKNIAISELKKLIEKCKGKSVDTKFDKPSVVRQPNAQRIPKPSVLGKPAPFSDSLERTNFAKKKSVSKTNESEGLSKPVTPQNLPQTATQACLEDPTALSWKPCQRGDSLNQPDHRYNILILKTVLRNGVSMADANINAPEVPVAAASPPTRSDEQILPRNKWVPVGKSNCFLDVERTQANPIFKIVMDILKNTNFFKAFTASSTIPSIYIQQFLVTIKFDKDKGYSAVNKANIDYAERIWEEFTQCIHSFIEDKMNQALHTEGKKKVNPVVIPGVRFTKLIINHLQSIHKFHKRPGSPLHLPYEESALGYLKFSFKNTKRVTKYQCYLAGKVVSDDEAPAPKPAKGAKPKTPRKPKPQSTSSQPPKPKPAPAKPQEKKRKLVMDTTEAPSPAKRSKAGHGRKLKGCYPAPRGPLPPVVIREPEPGKYEPLPEVQGKGKEKVGEEQAAQVLLNLQTPKKKNPAEQFIFQRRTPAPTVPSSHEESSSLYVELGLTDSETESDNEASREGQAGSDPGKQVEGQAGSDPGVAADSRIQPSHVVHAGPNLKHMNLEVSDTSPQPNLEQMDEEFTTTAYPNVQENLKIPTEGEVRLEEPASSAGTLSSMQNLDKELSFTNQFLAEKSQEDEPEKTNTEVEVQSMVTVPIHQDTSSVPLMTSLIIDLTVS